MLELCKLHCNCGCLYWNILKLDQKLEKWKRLRFSFTFVEKVHEDINQVWEQYFLKAFLELLWLKMMFFELSSWLKYTFWKLKSFYSKLENFNSKAWKLLFESVKAFLRKIQVKKLSDIKIIAIKPKVQILIAF